MVYALVGSNTRHLDIRFRSHSKEKYHYCKVSTLHVFSWVTDGDKMFAHPGTDTGDQPSLCAVCGNCFSGKDHLEGHLCIHTGENLYICTVFKKRFLTEFHLNEHLCTRTREKPFVCTTCDNTSKWLPSCVNAEMCTKITFLQGISYRMSHSVW